jgi:hypothetical protein
MKRVRVYVAVPAVAFLCLGMLPLCAAAQDSIQYRLLKGPDYQVFEDGVTPRARVRTNYYKEVPGDQWGVSPGQVSIEYGLPVWKPEYGPMFEKMPLKKRWRLGSNYWTNLSSSFPFEIGGTQLKPGCYYLVLERTDQARWSLIILDPADVTRRQLDPYHVNLKDSGPGTPVALEWERTGKTADRLEITLRLQDDDPKKMSIHIRFGPYLFRSVPLRVQF